MQTVIAAAAHALVHPGLPPAPHDLARVWHWQPLTLVGLAGAVGLYALGTWRLWRRAGVGRGIRRRHALAYAAGIVSLVVALVSPLDALSGALFSAHMTQHLVLIVVSAPLLVLGLP